MARIWQYQCQGCSFDIVAGSRCWECPYCGGDLRLIVIIEREDYLEEKQIDSAMKDIMGGLEDMLRNS